MQLAMKFVVVTSLLVFSAPGFAQIPDTQYSQGISYISGGVGEEESTAILAEAKQWPLLLELSQLEGGRGVWIFGAKIKILNANNHVIFDAQADGPYILINLAAGTYSVDAVYQGAPQKRVISINPATPQKISIFWK
ncbi:carboxypeptidase regulatory-like domain-containing protein [Polynucleobacter sp. AP-Nino-20-G2]|uniref:carboxypeptidase regulatory-like domain-containing protein n=1 Tax=Polynucleobacter sp. AP-Nino-20-G2 TaxID=2576917 RepID=UPI001BFD592E|nr:carboxypeptidase regulatory-like domain-containing protein [Polynucleobacter sp. AP-Nino-20-G2]QWE16196.1 carboxypeptidase regulatory-like domain-containing protein [Polynucleobacter sp. AP-Nino-20-G2]